MSLYQRPDKINKYKKQAAFIDAAERFTIVEAATKAGKTTGCIVWLFEQAFYGKEGDNCWWVAPVNSVAKIALRRMARFIHHKSDITINRTEQSITLKNGVTIYFKSGDQPDSLYGEDVIAAVIDEASRMQEDSWTAILTTLTATNGKCKIIGNVKGTNNWAYKLARQAEANELPDWRYFRLTVDDAVAAGVLKQEAVDAAKLVMPTPVFLELYYGIPNQNSSSKFCYAFDDKKHIGKCSIHRQFPIYLSFDFNRNPICCSVIQYYGRRIFVTHCIKLANSNIYSLCREIRTKFGRTHFIVTGDATGQNMSALVSDNLNYYKIIGRELLVPLSYMRVPTVNPPIEQNQVLINSLLEHYPITVDPDNAQALISDFKFVEVLPSGQIKKGDRNDPNQQADALDTFRYWCNVFMGNWLEYGPPNPRRGA